MGLGHERKRVNMFPDDNMWQLLGDKTSLFVMQLWVRGLVRLHQDPKLKADNQYAQKVKRRVGLSGHPDACPHWAQYRETAEKILLGEFKHKFGINNEDGALRRAWQLNGTPGFTKLLEAISRHPDLERIMRAGVQREVDILPVQPENDPRDDVEPLAEIAYKLHNIATQIHFLANREQDGYFGVEPLATAADSEGPSRLNSIAISLMEHSRYIRTCAVSTRKHVTMLEGLQQRFGGASGRPVDHSWWADLTERPISSPILAYVEEATTVDQFGNLLNHFADECEMLGVELDEIYERKWGGPFTKQAPLGNVLGGTAHFAGNFLRSRSKDLGVCKTAEF